jgi:hypothetical protein
VLGHVDDFGSWKVHGVQIHPTVYQVFRATPSCEKDDRTVKFTMFTDAQGRIKAVRYLSFSSDRDYLIARDAVPMSMPGEVRLASETTRLTFPDRPWEVELVIRRQDGWAFFTIEKEAKVALSCAVAWTPRGSRRAALPLLQIRKETLGMGDPSWMANLSTPPAWLGVAVHPFFATSLNPSEIMWFGECERAITFAVLDLVAWAGK